MRKILFSLLSCLCLLGCASFGTVEKTMDLNPGMTRQEVKGVLGKPSQVQFIAGKIVWKYNLHQYWKGWVPYYLAFDQESGKLETWFADEEEYYRNQRLWLDSMPRKVDVNANVTGNINHNVSGNINHHVSY